MAANGQKCHKPNVHGKCAKRIDNKYNQCNLMSNYTRGITHSVSAWRWEGDGFDS